MRLGSLDQSVQKHFLDALENQGQVCLECARFLNTLTRFYIYVFLMNSRFYGVVWILFLLDRGLTYTQITALDVAFWGIIILLSLPAGTLTDRFSRKIGMIGGQLLVAVGILIFVANPTVVGVFIAYLFWSTGSAFLNGPDQAFIYDYLKAENQEDRFPSIWRNVMIISHLAWALASLIGGFAGKEDLGYPFFLAAVCYVLAALAALSLKEKRPATDEAQPSPMTLLKEAVRITRRSTKIQILFILSSVIMCMGFIEVIFRAPLLKNEFGFDEGELGVIYFVIVIVAASGAYLSRYLTQVIGAHAAYILMAWLLAFSLLALSQPSVYVVLPIVLAIGFFRGLQRPLMAEILNAWIPSRVRASMITLGSGVSLIFLWLFEPLSGVLAESLTIQDMFVILGSLNILLLIVLTILWFRSLKDITPVDAQPVPVVDKLVINGIRE
ncbi:MAG: MFS transporter [Candidatus Hodarchaeales archaeon]